MWIEKATLRHFRNYADVSLLWSPGKNVFIGQNAAGKTNILEAVTVLSRGRSPRTRSDRELVQWQESFATVSLTAHAQITGTTLDVEAQFVLSPEGNLKTLFKLNHKSVRSRSDVVGKIPTVTFFLSDLLMLRGGPEDRRSALDSCLVQFDPLHFKRLSTYQRIRQQKSQWLKQFSQTGDNAILDSLNQQLAQAGAAVIQARVSYLHQIEPLAEIRYLELCQGKEHLTMNYRMSPGTKTLGNGIEEQAIIEELLQAMADLKHEELRRQQVLVGPHRDDISFYIEDKDAAHFGSQGQQRSIVLAFKLAEIEILRNRLDGETPILLLDDVMAELDPGRQHELLAHFDGNLQVFLTTTHLDSEIQWLLKDRGQVQVFAVSQGHVEPVSLQTVMREYV